MLSAVPSFDDARRAALVTDILRLLQGKPRDLLPFEAVRETLRLRGVVDRGVRDVPLDDIVGSLGRDREFNRVFLPREEALRDRWNDVRAMTLGQEGFPRVELYKVGEAFFVLDGHHRISVARVLAAPTIEAHVLEFVTDVPLEPDDTIEHLALRRGRADFLEATGIDAELTEPHGYARLLDHITVHSYYRGLDLDRCFEWDEAVPSWRDLVYLPMLEIIRESNILELFPGRTETDLYLYAMDHLHYLRERYGDAPPAAAVREMEEEMMSWPMRVRRFLNLAT